MAVLKASDDVEIPNELRSEGRNVVVLFCHGLNSEKFEDGLFEEQYTCISQRADAFFFDFRGHGDSRLPSSQATVSGMCLDLVSCLEHLMLRRYSDIRIVAASFGASVVLFSLRAITSYPVKRAVFWNPVVSFLNTFVEPVTPWGDRIFGGRRWSEWLLAPRVHIPNTAFDLGPEMVAQLQIFEPEAVPWPEDVPLMMLHGDSDTVVPYAASRRYAEQNPGGVRLHTIGGADHGFEGFEDEVFKVTSAWLFDSKG